MRRFVLLALALALAGPAISLPADPVALHRQFAGWSSADALAWRATGTRGTGPGALALTETHRGILFRMTSANGAGVTTQSGFNGRLVWSADENGFLAVQLGRAAQTQIALDVLRSEALANLNPAVTSHVTIGGRPASVLRMQMNGLPPVDVYEDDASGAYIRAVVAPGSDDERVIDDLSYTQVGGRRFLTGWRAQNGVYRLTNLDPSATVSDTDLRAGAPTASWSFDAAPVRFDLATMTDTSRIVRVSATVNGKTGTFVLSTGAPSIILYSDFAREAGVQEAGTAPYTPYAGNPLLAGYARVRELRVGNSVLRNVVVTEMTQPASRLAGILGYDFFANAIVNVDLVKQQLTLSDTQTPAKPGPGGYAFPIDLTTRMPAISLALDDGEAHPVIDTSLTGFILASQQLRNSGRITGHDISSQAAVGFGGQGATADPIATMGLNLSYSDWHAESTSGACVSSDRALAIGPYRYESPPVCFGGVNVFGADGGLVGLDFLRHFNWTADYPHGVFIVTPNGQ